MEDTQIFGKKTEERESALTPEHPLEHTNKDNTHYKVKRKQKHEQQKLQTQIFI